MEEKELKIVAYRNPNFKRKERNFMDNNGDKKVLKQIVKRNRAICNDTPEVNLPSTENQTPQPYDCEIQQQENVLSMVQSNLPIVSEQQFIQPVSPPFIPSYEPERYVTYGEIQNAGVNYRQAQQLNFQAEQTNLELYKLAKSQEITIMAKFWYENFRNSTFQKQNNDESISVATSPFQLDELARKMLDTILPINLHSRFSPKIFIRDLDRNRHISVSNNDLQEKLLCYVDNFPEIENLSQTEFAKLIKIFKGKIPLLRNSTLENVDDLHLVFANGIFDFGKCEFDSVSKNIFTTFSIPFRCNFYAENPDIFDAMLTDMTGDDETLKQLIYEVIGAILSNVPTLKKIFVFQGVSNGGKTRLMHIISSLFDEDDVTFVNNVSEITTESFRKVINNRHLVCVNDSADKKIAAVQASFLKSFADGSNREIGGNATKILLATNHAITSGENGFLEQALRNRLLVIPFRKPMDLTDERVQCFESCYLAYEREGILKKALLAFSNVVQNGFRFTCEPPINEVVCESNLNFYSDEERAKVNEIAKQGARELPFVDVKSKIFGDIFELTEGLNANMTIENIKTILKKIRPNLVSNNNQLGKDLKKYFGEKLKLGRCNDGAICYNLSFKNFSTTISSVVE